MGQGLLHNINCIGTHLNFIKVTNFCKVGRKTLFILRGVMGGLFLLIAQIAFAQKVSVLKKEIAAETAAYF